MTDQHKSYLAFAKQLALDAGEIITTYYRTTNLEIKWKEDNSPVTIADKEVNSLVVEAVKSRYTEHGVRGEEESWNPEAHSLWVCDPIDGTKAYMLEIPVAMFSIALVEEGVPLVAVAYNPFTHELFSAVKGNGATLNDGKIQVSSRRWGEKSRLVKSDSETSSKYLLGSSEKVLELAKENINVFTCPGAVFRGCNIAAGAFDGTYFYGDGAHDIAAVKLIIEEAGGKVTDISGKEQRYDQPINGAILSNGLIHEKLITMLQQ